MAVSSKRYLFRIPHDSAVVKYLGFRPLNHLESATDLIKPKYLTTSSKGSRYRLEEIGIAGLGCNPGKAYYLCPRSKDVALKIEQLRIPRELSKHINNRTDPRLFRSLP